MCKTRLKMTKISLKIGTPYCYYVSNAKEWLVKTEETPLEYSGIKMRFPTKDTTIIKCVKPD